MWFIQRGKDGGLLNSAWIKTLYINDDNWLVVQLHGSKPTKLIHFASFEEAEAYLFELGKLISKKDCVVRLD